MRLDVYGTKIEVTREGERWMVFYLGQEGKKRLAKDLTIPSDVREHEVKQYMADLCHEWATPRNNEVFQFE